MSTSIPGPRGWPWVGSLPGFIRDPLAFLTRMAAEHGDRSVFRLGPLSIYLLLDSDDIEAVVSKQWQSLHKDEIYEYLRGLLGNGLVTSEGDLWKRQRRLAAPSFTPRQIRAYGDVMAEIAERSVATLQGGESRDIHAAFMRLTMEIVLATVFGVDAGVDAKLVERCIGTYMHGFMTDAQGWQRLIPRSIPTPTRKAVARTIVELDEAILPLVRDRRASGEERDDLLGRLLAARDEEGRGMDDKQLRDEVITLFVAGHETTALALTYAVVLLSETPEARERLEAEVDAVLGDRPPGLADLADLPWTRACILEAMRIYPPVWAFGREAIEPVTLGEHVLPRGSQIMGAPWVNHRDPRWFDDPLVYRPERWLDGLEKRLPRYVYMPFGVGPRICIGNHFAMMEAVLALAATARQVRLDWDGAPLDLMASVTLRPRRPVHVKVTRRRAVEPARIERVRAEA